MKNRIITEVIRPSSKPSEVKSNVPFLDLQAATRELREEIDCAVARVLDSGYFLLGKELQAFEREFAEYAGDEVLVPGNTYLATWLGVSYVGARPVPVEPDERTYNIDPEKIEAAITKNTKGILPVHLYGQPADMGRIKEIAAKRNLWILED